MVYGLLAAEYTAHIVWPGQREKYPALRWLKRGQNTPGKKGVGLMGINSSMIEISFPSCNSLPCTKSMMLGYI
jgi:hypothetical protein